MDGTSNLYKGNDGTALRFHYEPVKNNFQSEKHGKALFDKSLMVDVLTPGSNESVPTFELERVYCAEAGIETAERSAKYTQYEAQIEAFKRQSGENTLEGMPIEHWPQIDVAQVAGLKEQNIHTVEQLASVTDGNLSRLGMGARVLRDQAAAYLQTRQFGVPTAAMTAEAANLRTENERLTASVLDLSNRLTTAQEENKLLRQGSNPPPTVDTLSLVSNVVQPAVDTLSLVSSVAQPDPFAMTQRPPEPLI